MRLIVALLITVAIANIVAAHGTLKSRGTKRESGSYSYCQDPSRTVLVTQYKQKDSYFLPHLRYRETHFHTIRTNSKEVVTPGHTEYETRCNTWRCIDPPQVHIGSCRLADMECNKKLAKRADGARIEGGLRRVLHLPAMRPNSRHQLAIGLTLALSVSAEAAQPAEAGWAMSLRLPSADTASDFKEDQK